jgi:hypothetical protein
VDHSSGQSIQHKARLQALRQSSLLDTPCEDAFDRLTRTVCRVLKVPVALFSLVDAERQFFKSAIGLPEPWASRRESPLSGVVQNVPFPGNTGNRQSFDGKGFFVLGVTPT